jgi:hypothetical protein
MQPFELHVTMQGLVCLGDPGFYSRVRNQVPDFVACFCSTRQFLGWYTKIGPFPCTVILIHLAEIFHFIKVSKLLYAHPVLKFI